jgi:uncharacterized protein (UPF0333 family)
MTRRGQSTLEYAVVIAVVLAALLAIQVYVKRGVQGKLRSSADSIGDQYSAGKTTSTYTTAQTGKMKTQEQYGKEAKGISYSSVITAAQVKRSAEGDAAEKINTTLNSEKLFE